ncbi:TPA: hypothetical protein O1366_001988 [Staphylococcus aureus]|nr:hypothetical protein [Staphylococcus aureus]HDC9121629.1 hypothetical protein [Staphylococcus aureus]HDJ2983063.1 hypothetical protein [Staphylococcus aureus]
MHCIASFLFLITTLNMTRELKNDVTFLCIPIPITT